MDYNTDHEAQLPTAMVPPNQPQQQSQQGLIEIMTHDPLQYSYQDAAFDSGALEEWDSRNTSHSLDPDQYSEEGQYLPPACPASPKDDNTPNGKGVDFGNTQENDIAAHNSSDTLCTDPSVSLGLPPQDSPGDKRGATFHDNDIQKHPLEHWRDRIQGYINAIKLNTPDSVIDHCTAIILTNEVADFISARGLATPKAIDQIRYNFPQLYHRASLTGNECAQAESQVASSPAPSSSELTSIPSDVSTFHASSVCGSDAAASCQKLENRSTQTKVTTTETGTNTSPLPEAPEHEPEEELWEWELESIRRRCPLVDGEYKIVDVPLRVSISKTAPTRQRVMTSAQRGTGHGGTPVPRVQSTARPAPKSGTAASNNRGYKPCDVIAINVISDEEEDSPPRMSRTAGGGDTVDDGDDDEITFRGRRNQSGRGPDGNRVTAMGAFVDGDYDLSEWSSCESKGSDDSLFFGEGMGQRGRPCTTPCVRGRATNKRTTHRERSRSPERPRPKEGRISFREERFYPNEYVRNQLPSLIHCEKQFGQANKRYMRDNPESPEFYGYTGNWSPNKVENALRYQDRFNNVGEVPGPKSGLRLDLDGYVKDTRINDNILGLHKFITYVRESTFFAGETLDEEQALRSSWNKEPTTLYKGFPLVESVGFIAMRNHAEPDGDCYWRALAYILYGQSSRWDVIKSDHQVYLRHVLDDKSHPRHELYTQLNTKFFESHGPMIKKNGSWTAVPAFRANLWQLLHMPHSWTPGAMQQITADLYNIHLVTFEYHRDSNKCSSVSVRGAYNSRHVFMLFINGCHFQPLAPNEHLGWEFRYPRVTVSATARYSNAPKADSKRIKESIQHPWRNDWTKVVPPPVPRNHGCDLFQLRQFMSIPRQTPDQAGRPSENGS